MNLRSKLDEFCQFFEQLSPVDLNRFHQFYAKDARFKDPFHDVIGLSDIETIFTHMFVVAPDARFQIEQTFTSETSAMIIWTMTLSLRNKPLSIVGSTHLQFNEHGLVCLHRDYWDTGEELLQKLPVIGWATKWLFNRFSALPKT